MVDKQQNAKGSEEESDALSLDELSGVAGGTGPGGPPSGGGGRPPGMYAPGEQPLPPMPGETMPGGGGMDGMGGMGF